MRLTSRDVRILLHLRDMRYLHREQIQRLEFDGRAESNTKRRLTLAYHSGLIGRRLLPSERPYGSQLALYYLDRAGESVLRRSNAPEPNSGDRRSRRGEREFFLRHLIDTNDARIAALLSARSHGFTYEWLDELTVRRRLTGVRLADHHQRPPLLAPIPDGFMRIDVGRVQLSFAVELDRATVEEARSKRKMRSYGAFHESNATVEQFFSAGLRVLYVVSHDDPAERSRREAQLKRWCAGERGGSLFWFTTLERVRGQDFFTAPIWSMVGQNERVALVDVPPRVTSRAPRGTTST